MTIKKCLAKEPDGLVARAYAFAAKSHAGQKRKSGEQYFTHPLAIAETLASWHLDDPSIAAGLLHDVVEDTGVPLEEVKRQFGAEVAFLVDGVTKLNRIKYHGADPVRNRARAGARPKGLGRAISNGAEEENAENLRKMMLAVGRDLRVIFVKLADRLHNMKTLGALPPAKQKRIALETDEIYAPIAYRLGMQSVSGELHDLAFPYLHPEEYRWIKTSSAEEYESRLKYLRAIQPMVEKALAENHLAPVAIDFRAKRYSSLYKKLLTHEMDIGKIYDLVAFRIVMKTVGDCYAALGVIHALWPPLPGRIKDYVAMPKPNGYRSLHTTVFGPQRKNIEFQIRTGEMHEENENGIAAHWLYKQKKNRGTLPAQQLTREVAWVQQLRNWQETQSDSSENSRQFLESMKADFFKDRIFVISPKGEVFDLPADATPVDFAYHIHSDVGDTAVAAKVNNRFVPLDTPLQSGDLVEIVTQKNKKPSEDWLAFVKTSQARDHIRRAVLHKKKNVVPAAPQPRAELRLVVKNRTGIVKDISALTTQSRLGILNTNISNQGSISVIKIQCGIGDNRKIEKLILKIKKLREVKEASYRVFGS